jgi:tripartite-type tricarboxylate transporter receptor subunit TctC
MAEARLPGFRSITWFALAAPPGTPAPLIAKLNRDTVTILKDPAVSDRLHRLELDPGATSPAQTAAFFAEELKLWGKVIEQAHISVQ